MTKEGVYNCTELSSFITLWGPVAAYMVFCSAFMKCGYFLETLQSGVPVKATKTNLKRYENQQLTELFKKIYKAHLTLLPCGDAARSGRMNTAYLANTALNIHYNNGGEVDAGGQDATGCISNHTGYRNVAAINTHSDNRTLPESSALRPTEISSSFGRMRACRGLFCSLTM